MEGRERVGAGGAGLGKVGCAAANEEAGCNGGLLKKWWESLLRVAQSGQWR